MWKGTMARPSNRRNLQKILHIYTYKQNHFFQTLFQSFMASYVLLCLVIFSQFTSILAQSDVYIIHMDSNSMPKIFSSRHSWYDSILSSMPNDVQVTTTGTAVNTPKLIYAYNNAMHGFSAKLTLSELKAVQNSPGFLSAIRDVPAIIHTSHSFEFLGLNDVSGAWPASSYGKDVIIGVIDSGVWPESESYNDAGMGEIPSRWKGICENGVAFNSSMCNKKLIGARAFSKALVAGDPTMTLSINSTRDDDGHGTHTSSTAAGNYVRGASYFGYGTGTTRGMAPRAHLAIYKTLWNEGSSGADTIAAIDQAIADGVDILSLSLAYDGFQLYEEPIAIASFAAMEKGIFVAVSAGNRGHRYAIVQNGTPWLLTVGAGTIDREFNGVASLGNGNSIVGKTLYPGKSLTKNVPLEFKGTCNDPEEIKMVGKKIVVCMDIDRTLRDQISNIRNDKKIAGGIFITNITSLNSFLATSFPALFLSLQDGQVLLDYINKTSNPTAKLEFQKITKLGTKPAPTVASYSSRGPSTLCPTVLKPDLIAPGSLILASWAAGAEVTKIGSRSVFGNFSIISGTSMSCPHTAGIAALIKGVHPTWSPAGIRSAMMTTSDVLDNTQSPITSIFGPTDPLSLGAGHVNPNKALDPGLIYDTNADDYVQLLCGMNYTMEQIQIITKSSKYNCSNASLDLNYPSFIAFFDTENSTGKIQVFRRTVTNMGDGLSTYTAKLTSIKGYKLKVVPTTLAFNKKQQKLSYTLSIESLGLTEANVFHGALSWVEVEGKHVVRSPIVATTLGKDVLS